MTTQQVTLPTIDRLPGHLTSYGADPKLVEAEYMQIVIDAITNAPRSQQVAIGPSEIGHDCPRRIGYKLLGFPERVDKPNWKATVGTGVHMWLEDQFAAANDGMDATRWLVEMRVNVGEILGNPILGHCDLFDRVTGTVIDHKTVGPTQLRKYKAQGPGRQYRTQAHLYGRGWTRRGQDVHRVAIVFLPRNGELADAVFWSEPYDEQVALAGLQRAEGIALAAQTLGPAALAHLGTADAFCALCPYYRAGSADPATGCPGDPGGRQAQTPHPALTIGAPA